MPTQLLTVFSFRRTNGETGYLNQHVSVEDPLTIEQVRALEAAICTTNQIAVAALIAAIPLGQAPAVAPDQNELTPAEKSLREILPYARTNMQSLIAIHDDFSRRVVLRRQLASAEAIVAALPS